MPGVIYTKFIKGESTQFFKELKMGLCYDTYNTIDIQLIIQSTPNISFYLIPEPEML
jgi:hypothetical protein